MADNQTLREVFHRIGNKLHAIGIISESTMVIGKGFLDKKASASELQLQLEKMIEAFQKITAVCKEAADSLEELKKEVHK